MKIETCSTNCDFYDSKTGNCLCVDGAPFPAELNKPCPLDEAIAEIDNAPENPFDFIPEAEKGFEGHKIDLEALDVYRQVRKHCSEIHRLCHCVNYRASMPTTEVSCAYCTLTFPAETVILNESIRCHLSGLFNICDRVIATATDKSLTYRFQIDRIWTEEIRHKH